MKIWIEEKDFEDRKEFRISIKEKYPSGLQREGTYERYLSRWIHWDTGGADVPYGFVAHKKNNWFKRFFGNDYRNQCRIAIQECDKLIDSYKKHSAEPRITNYDR